MDRERVYPRVCGGAPCNILETFVSPRLSLRVRENLPAEVENGP